MNYIILEMEKSNYQKVVEFCKTFGHPAHNNVQHDVWTKDPKLVKLRVDLIREEFNELVHAVEHHDMVETVDALADILVVTYGMGAAFGVDLDKAMSLVHESNMSKICSTEDEAKKTTDWYKTEFVEGRQPYDSPTYRKSPCGEKWVVFNESTGKILKNINYHAVDLTELVGKQEVEAV